METNERRTMTTYTVTTASGRTVTRRSDASYVAASERNGQVKFHQTRDAARRAAGANGRVHDVGEQRPAAAPSDSQTWVAEDADGNCHDFQYTPNNSAPPHRVARDHFGWTPRRTTRKGWR
jgi:hypothetical protein